ncbi:MAG: hypothetical protein AAGG69_02140 [Pseudomonadota bacterium]
MDKPKSPINLSAASGSDHAQLKAATRRLVRLAGGPESAQHVTRVKASALSRFGSVSDDQFIPVDVVADLESDTGSAVVTAALATLLGCRLVGCESAGTQSAPLGVESIASLLQREANLVGQIAEAMADGKVTPIEAQQISETCERAIAGLRGVQRSARASANLGGEGGGHA